MRYDAISMIVAVRMPVPLLNGRWGSTMCVWCDAEQSAHRGRLVAIHVEFYYHTRELSDVSSHRVAF